MYFIRCIVFIHYTGSLVTIIIHFRFKILIIRGLLKNSIDKQFHILSYTIMSFSVSITHYVRLSIEG